MRTARIIEISYSRRRRCDDGEFLIHHTDTALFLDLNNKDNVDSVFRLTVHSLLIGFTLFICCYNYYHGMYKCGRITARNRFSQSKLSGQSKRPSRFDLLGALWSCTINNFAASFYS